MKLDDIPMLGMSAPLALCSYIWGRSAMRLVRSHRNIERSIEMPGGISGSNIHSDAAAQPKVKSAMSSGHSLGRDSLVLAKSAYLKSFHLAFLYGLFALACLVGAFLPGGSEGWPFLACASMVVVTFSRSRPLMREARLVEARATLELRAEEVLAQHELAPLRWSERLAPEELPTIEGFEVAHHYQAGAGAMAGDFYDLFRTSNSRFAVAIGDVTGHGLEPAITAFQVKNLLRVFLKQFRDPAQVLQELNSLVCSQSRVDGRNEEMVSVCLVVMDQAAGTLRFASAGHPPAWFFHAGNVRPLRSTGPILALDPNADYFSREIPMESGDVLLLYTDGLVEVRSGGEMFGEERVASALARDPRQPMDILCKTVVNSAAEFAAQPFGDDVAVLAIRYG